MTRDTTEQLLVRLSRVRPAPKLAASDLVGVDVERLLHVAGRIGNFALIAHRLLEPGLGLPPEVRGKMERNLHHHQLREQLGTADTRDLSAALARKGEAVLLLKGISYSRFIYPRRGIRSALDIDVLITPEAVDEAIRILHQMGYSTMTTIDGSIELHRRIGGINLNLELHTKLLHLLDYPHYSSRLALNEARLMQRAEEKRLDGAPVLVLRAADELAYSVVHFFYHHDLAGLKYHSDLNALMTDPNRPLDVEEAIAVARDARVQYAVGLALEVQRTCFGEESVPSELTRALRPGWIRMMSLGAILPPFSRIALTEGRVGGHPSKVLVAPGFWAPIGLAFRWLFPGKTYLKMYYRLDEQSWRWRYFVRYAATTVGNALRRRA